MPARNQRQGRIILLTLIAAITVDKVFISRELPEVSEWVWVNPMPVFLDIPADLSMGFGVVPVSILFMLLYGASLMTHRSGKTTGEHYSRPPSVWKAFTALLIVPCWIGSGCLLYRLTEDELPRQIRNAIESFGITADIHSLLPGHELIHLRGSMVMFVFLFPGLYFCNRRIGRRIPAVTIDHPPVGAPSNAIAIASLPEDPIPVPTACTEITPVTVSPVRIHVQYPRSFDPDC